MAELKEEKDYVTRMRNEPEEKPRTPQLVELDFDSADERKAFAVSVFAKLVDINEHFVFGDNLPSDEKAIEKKSEKKGPRKSSEEQKADIVKMDEVLDSWNKEKPKADAWIVPPWFCRAPINDVDKEQRQKPRRSRPETEEAEQKGEQRAALRDERIRITKRLDDFAGIGAHDGDPIAIYIGINRTPFNLSEKDNSELSVRQINKRRYGWTHANATKNLLLLVDSKIDTLRKVPTRLAGILHESKYKDHIKYAIYPWIGKDDSVEYRKMFNLEEPAVAIESGVRDKVHIKDMTIDMDESNGRRRRGRGGKKQAPSIRGGRGRGRGRGQRHRQASSVHEPAAL